MSGSLWLRATQARKTGDVSQTARPPPRTRSLTTIKLISIWPHLPKN
jgi:hypothetical protein